MRFSGLLFAAALFASRGASAQPAAAPVAAQAAQPQQAAPADEKKPAPSEVAPVPVAPAPAPSEAAPAAAASDADPAKDMKAEEPAAAGPADAPDDPAVASDVDEAAKELEELRAAEEATLDDGSRRAAALYRMLERLGPATPLRDALEDGLSSDVGLPVIPDSNEVEAAALAEVGAFDIEKAKREYDIPVEMQPLVAEYIHFFQTAARKHFVRWLGRSYRYLPMMRKKLREEGLPEDTVYLAMIESGFSNLAFSRAKAAGPWQFIQATGQRYGLIVDFWRDDRRDPVRATGAAAQYLKELYQEFGDWRLAWAAYNAGENKIRKAIKVENTRDFWDMTNGRTLRKETKHYVPKLMAAALISKHLKQFGFSEEEILREDPLDYETVDVPEPTDLEVVARAAGTTVDALTDLNPELRRWCTPPSRKAGEAFTLKVPKGTAEKFAGNFAQIPAGERLNFRAHQVSRGDTLSKIAQRYGSAPEAIMRMNGLRDSRRLKLGLELVIPVPRAAKDRVQLAEVSRRRGFYAAPVDQEVPASAPVRSGGRTLLSGVVKTVREGGKNKVIYAVAAGDSLWSIAHHFQVTVNELRDWNGLGEQKKNLKLGQELVIFPSEKQASKGDGRKVARKEPAAAHGRAAHP